MLLVFFKVFKIIYPTNFYKFFVIFLMLKADFYPLSRISEKIVYNINWVENLVF